jgi:PPP family 3-phenylpropionic acid transporter
MLGAVKPLTTFIVAPFWGILSDGMGDRFRILYFTFLVSVVAQMLVAVRHDFYYLVVMVFVTAFFNAPVKSLIDSMVMDNLPDRRHYGRLRLWGQMGFGLGSSWVGILLSKSKGVAEILPHHSFLYKCWQNLTGYNLLFFTYAALSIPTWMCLKTFEGIEKEKQLTVSKKAPKEGAHIWQGLKLLVQNADALLFFFLVFVVGTSSGCIENFAYVRMREVGGSGKEMGLSRLVSSAAGAPMFWFSGPLTEKLGADRVLALSLLSYVARFFIYAFMRNPYHGLPAEALRGVTFAAFWSTSTIYAHRISPPGMSATMVRLKCFMILIFNRTEPHMNDPSLQLMFLNAMYGGLGQSLGAIIGGKLQSKFGTVKTFVYSGIFDLCFVGFLLLYLGLRKDSSFRNATPIGMDLDEKKKKQ